MPISFFFFLSCLCNGTSLPTTTTFPFQTSFPGHARRKQTATPRPTSLISHAGPDENKKKRKNFKDNHCSLLLSTRGSVFFFPSLCLFFVSLSSHHRLDHTRLIPGPLSNTQRCRCRPRYWLARTRRCGVLVIPGRDPIVTDRSRREFA